MRFLWLVPLSLAILAPRADADGLRLRHAVLTLGGVGIFHYEAVAGADGLVTLDVRRGDVDDVLKSLTVPDGAAAITGMQLAGPDGTAAAFAALPFNPAALSDPLKLLNALHGVTLEVRDPSGRDVVLTGRMVGATRTREPVGTTRDGLERTRVTVLTETGLRQFVLEESGAVRVADPPLQARIDAALSALRGQADGERREIALRTNAAPGQTVRIAVVTATPLWKATYRLMLPASGQKTARLQGWAVLENATATDWDHVAVTLQTGNPVTFRQKLWEPAPVTRPDIPVERQARPMPRADMAAAPASALSLRAAAAPPPEQATITEGIAATRFDLKAPVSLATGEVASLPFLDAEVPAESLGLLEFQQTHPLAAVRLTNTTGGGLPGGAVATFDGPAFAGDALLPPLPSEEPRVLTFAEDLAVTAHWNQDSGQEVTGLTVAGGVAHLTRTERTTTHIELTGAAAEARTLLLGLPRIEDAKLTLTGASLSEQTGTQWRARVTLAPGEHRDVTATADRLVGEDLALTDDPDAILRLRGLNFVSAEARAAIERIAGLRQEQARHDAEHDRLIAQRQDITTDEQRLRDNLAAVPASDPLHARLLRQLDAAETRLDDLGARAGRAAEASRQAREALTAAIAALSIGG